MTGASLVGCDTWRLYHTDDADAPMIMPEPPNQTSERAGTRVSEEIRRSMRRHLAAPELTTGVAARKCWLTFGERGGGLGVEADDEVEHGHEDPSAAYAADGAERGAEEPDDGGHHHPPIEREILEKTDRRGQETDERDENRLPECQGKGGGKRASGLRARRARSGRPGVAGHRSARRRRAGPQPR